MSGVIHMQRAYHHRRQYSGVPKTRKPKPSGRIPRTPTTFSIRRAKRALRLP